jgi:hypothetical protein
MIFVLPCYVFCVCQMAFKCFVVEATINQEYFSFLPTHVDYAYKMQNRVPFDKNTVIAVRFICDHNGRSAISRKLLIKITATIVDTYGSQYTDPF